MHRARQSRLTALLALSLLCAGASLLLAAASASARPSGAHMALSSASAAKKSAGRRHRARTRASDTPRPQQLLRQARAVSSAAPAASTAPADRGSTLIDAGFENGLANWNITGVGEAVPTVESGDARTGSKAARVVLNGSQDRSELILGGDGGDSTDGQVEFREGDEYWYGFSFNIESMVYGSPLTGSHNIIMQFKSEGEGSPAFGLQLWDYAGDDGHSGGRGLWSSESAMGGDRFLAPVSEHQWHDVAIHFRASSVGAGFYELYLDGQLIDSRSGVSMIVPGHETAYIKNGIYRNGEAAPGHSELLLDSARLGTTAASVSPAA